MWKTQDHQCQNEQVVILWDCVTMAIHTFLTSSLKRIHANQAVRQTSSGKEHCASKQLPLSPTSFIINCMCKLLLQLWEPSTKTAPLRPKAALKLQRSLIWCEILWWKPSTLLSDLLIMMMPCLAVQSYGANSSQKSLQASFSKGFVCPIVILESWCLTVLVNCMLLWFPWLHIQLTMCPPHWAQRSFYFWSTAIWQISA